MSENFVTQLTADQPLVAIVGAPAVIAQTISGWCEDHHLAVKSVSQLTAQTFADPNQDWYKCFWYVDTLQENTPTLEKKREALQAFGQPPVILCQGITPLQEANGGYFHSWAEVTKKQQEILSWLKFHFPGSPLYVFLDVIDAKLNELNPCWHFASTFDQGAWSNPVVPLYPQSISQALELIKTRLFQPVRPTVGIVRGSRILSTQLLNQLHGHYARIQGQSLPIQAVPAQTWEWPEEMDFIEDANPHQLDQSLRTVAYQLPKASEIAKRPLPQRTPRPVPATPSISTSPDKPAATNQVSDKPTHTAATPASAETIPVSQPAKPVATVEVESKPEPKPRAADGELDEAILKVFAQERKKDKVAHVRQAATTTKVVTKKTKRRKLLYRVGVSTGAVLVGIVVLATIYLVNTWSIKQLVYRQAAAVSADQQPNFQWWQHGIVASLEGQTLVYSRMFGWLSLIQFDQSLHYAQLWHKLEQISLDYGQWQTDVRQVTLQALGNDEAVPTDVKQLAAVGDKLQQQLADLQAVLSQVDNTVLSSKHQTELLTFEKKVSQQRKQLSVFQQLSPQLPKMLGYEGKRRYAILIQNNQELRPTGGFIQAVGVLTLDQGNLINSQFWSSYELDEKVSGVVKPPDDLQVALGESRLWLRDSNWSPDFPSAAQQSAWFVAQATNSQIDGVIALNLESLKMLIKALGPIELPEYNEVITDKNLEERMEFHSEIQLVRQPNSPPPRDYTATLAQKIVSMLGTMPPDKTAAVLAALNQGLQQHELLISMVDSPTLNEPLLALGWNGSLVTPGCPAQFTSNNCLVDTFSQVEANVGINKANYYIEKRVLHEITVSPDVITHHRIISWQNKANNNAWPKGSYKAFTRFYLPKDAQLKEILLQGKPLSTSQFSTRLEQDKLVVAVLTETPVQQTSQVELSYQVPNPAGEQLAYTYFEQKQPGSQAKSQEIHVAFSPSVSPTLIAPQAEVRGQVVVFTPPTIDHTFVGVQLQ